MTYQGMRKQTDPFQVLVLSDGRPGHFNQSRGVVRALSECRRVQVSWLDVKLRCSLFRRLLGSMLNATRRRLSLFSLYSAYHVSQKLDVSPDLIISAGGNTLYANVLLARFLECRNLFAGNIRRLRERQFSGIITPDAAHVGNPRYIVAPTPTAIVPEEVQASARGYRFQYGLSDERTWVLLVGGNGGGIRYQADDWANLCGAMKNLAETYGIRWLVITSRRTGKRVESILAKKLDCCWVSRLERYSHGNPSNYKAILGCGERLFCTEDSSMMVVEGVAAGRIVETLRPERATLDFSNQQVLDRYVERQLIVQRTFEQFGELGYSVPRPRCFPESQADTLACKLDHWLEETSSNGMSS